MFAGDFEDDFVLQNVDFVTFVQIITSHQGSVRNDDDAVLLSEFHKGVVRQVRMHFDLQNCWLDFAGGEEFHEQLSVEVAHS